MSELDRLRRRANFVGLAHRAVDVVSMVDLVGAFALLLSGYLVAAFGVLLVCVGFQVLGIYTKRAKLVAEFEYAEALFDAEDWT